MWQDIKNKTKTKEAARKRSANKTGGGPPIQIKASDAENKVLELMGPEVIHGIERTKESAIVSLYDEKCYMYTQVIISFYNL